MGWITFTLSQLVFTSVTLGALKKNGTIQVNSKAIKNEFARSAFETALDLGEDLATRGERFWRAIMDPANKQ